MRTKDELLAGTFTLLVEMNVFTLEEVHEALNEGTNDVWDLLYDKIIQVKSMKILKENL